MSRIGKKPITIPPGVEISFNDHVFKCKGPKGELICHVHPTVNVEKKDNTLEISINDKEDLSQKALWGTMRQIIANNIEGVLNGYQKQLEIKGVGYKAELKGDTLMLSVGYSHDVKFPLPKGLKGSVEKNIITLEGIDKQLLGETAANIRKVRKPEPYKGKGIKYVEETILRKAGKQVKSGA